jgi:hypothetical protein
MAMTSLARVWPVPTPRSLLSARAHRRTKPSLLLVGFSVPLPRAVGRESHATVAAARVAQVSNFLTRE